MTHLATHINTTGLSQASLAKELGISRSHMSELVSGAKKPSLDLAFAIERVTEGAVPAASWTEEQSRAS